MSRTIPNPTSTMVRCLPNGICSWNYRLSGEAHNGETRLHWCSEHGSLFVDGVNLTVQKHGVYSGHWTLEHEGEEVASAHKTSAFTRALDINAPGGPLLLAADSPFTRCFTLRRDEHPIATMRPDHPLTRRGKIEILTSDYDSPTVLFAFWLVALMWRRAAQKN